MPRFIEGQDRQQVTLMPECLDDFIADDNPVRVIDAFVGELDLTKLGFAGAEPAATGRPSYHPADLLKVYIYGYLNRVQSSRRLERECQRNIELMWLTGRLVPDFKTIADFRRDNGAGIRNVCRRFVALCRDLKLFSQALVAIDGSKFKAVNARDKNFTAGKIDKRQQQIEESIHRYLVALDTADRTQPAEFEAKTTRLKGKIEQLRQQMRVLDEVKVQVATQPDGQLSKTDPDARSMATNGRGSGIVGYNVQVAVDAKHHLIVAHEVTNLGHDRVSLAPVAQAAREAMGKKRLRAIADRGYYSALQIKACADSGIAPILPKPTWEAFEHNAARPLRPRGQLTSGQSVGGGGRNIRNGRLSQPQKAIPNERLVAMQVIKRNPEAWRGPKLANDTDTSASPIDRSL